MKVVKFLVAGLVLASLVACDKLAKVAFPNDSSDADTEAVQADEALEQKEVEQMSELINAVAMSLDSIQVQEQMVTRMDESTPKDEILSRLQAFKDLLDRKKKEIDLLTAESLSNKSTIANLKKTLEYLNQQLEEKSERIAKLEEAVRTRDATISELREEVDALNIKAGQLEEKNIAQENQLNEAFYIVAPKKELKNLGLLSGGFLSKKRANYSNIDNSVFKKVDVRIFKTLVINSKSPKLMTEKPASSYMLTKNDDGTSTLTITNAKDFWGASPYLIIME